MSRHRYTHDAEGNRLTQVEELTVAGGAAPGSAETTEYGYDEESRLVGVRYPDNTAALYQLDAVGNRVGERKAVAGLVPALTAAAFLAVSPAALTNDVVAVFNRADWLESVADSRAPAKDATFEWDAARDRRFTWDVKQTLTKVEDNGIESGRYDYGADGLRSKRVTSLESVEYVLDGMQVLVETDGAVSAHPAKRRYHYASAALAVTDISGATRTTKALHLDALGSPATETTQAGAVAAVRQYDAWGLYRNGTAPGSADAKLGYTGHQYDPETGLVYARARYYDAEYGRFLSRDSVEGALNSAPSLHRFAYARENPLRYTDSTGHCPQCVGVAAGALIGFGIGFGAALLDGADVRSAFVTGGIVGVAGGMIGGSLGAAAGPGFAMAANAMAVRGAAGFAVSATREFTAAKAENRDVRVSNVVLGTAMFAAPVPKALMIPLGIGAGALGGAEAVKTIEEGRNGKNIAKVVLGFEDLVLSGLSFGAGARGAASWAGVGRGGPPPTLVPAEGMLRSSSGTATAQGGFNPFPLFAQRADEKPEVGQPHPQTGNEVLAETPRAPSTSLDESIQSAKPSTRVTDYLENPGHHDPTNPETYNPNKSVLPENQEELFKSSVFFKNKRWARDEEGAIHQFMKSGEDVFHWAGSENGVTQSGKPRSIKVDSGVQKAIDESLEVK